MGDRKFRLFQGIQLKVKLPLQMMKCSSLLVVSFMITGNWIRSTENRNENTVSFYIWDDISRFTLLILDFLDPRQELSLHIPQKLTSLSLLFLQTPCSTQTVNRQYEVHQTTDCQSPAEADLRPGSVSTAPACYRHSTPLGTKAVAERISISTSLLKEILHFPHSNNYYHAHLP